MNVYVGYASVLAFNNAPVRTYTHIHIYIQSEREREIQMHGKLHGRAVGQTSDELKPANWTHEA